MTTKLPSLLCAALGLALGARAQETVTSILGFSAESAARERTFEREFDQRLDAADLRTWLQTMSSEPNQVGSEHDKQNAEFMLAKFKEWGWDAHLETFYVLYPTLQQHALELVAPTKFTAKLFEPAIPGDRTSGNTKTAVPPYNVYGADGDVTAELVYVNYGMPDDYADLARRGIDPAGRIVITRYGSGWRGLKAKLAYEHGAVGCIIYSDPRDDGYYQGDAYPAGGYRPADGVQRGSVKDITLYPGDPLTPGIGATKDAKRLPLEEATTILKIPVIPISFSDAQPLLQALAGPVAPEDWRGALPFTYHLGPGPARVHLMIKSEWTQKPIYDVIATLAGREFPDQWVLRGNHHDGWVFGAWDPLAGNVALLEEAKAIGLLTKTGWRPKRTLVYTGWDGEEPGLLGSTEWAEEHADELQQKAVLYVNSDTNGRGFLDAGGSHSLQHFVNQVADTIRDPETGVSVNERLRAVRQVAGYARGAGEEARRLAQRAAAGGDLPLAALGSGSDYSAFLQHLGIATLSLEYRGEDADAGIYHSAYDSFDHYLRYGDPNFAYGIVLAETIGHVMLRTADADVLPMRFGDFADTVGDYAQELHQLADRMRAHAEELDRMLDKRAFQLAADPGVVSVPPPAETRVPFLDFAALDNAVSRLKLSAAAYDDTYAHAATRELSLGTDRLTRLNTLLQGMEQSLLDPAGLPGREWYRHLIYAPGMYTGYGAKTLPGVREAIEQRRWSEADQFIVRTAAVLNAYSDRLDKAQALYKF